MSGLSFRQFIVVAVLFVAVAPFRGYAQLSSASVTGVVRDTSGSVIPSVRITLQNVETTVAHTSVSNTAGNYVFLGITPGEYTLTAEVTGFEVSKMPAFTLAVNQTATIDLTMQVGTVQQSLTVEASGQLVQSATAELGAVVSEKQVFDLPLTGRNFTQLLSLTPGVAPVSVSQNAGGFGNVFTGGAFVFPAINGQTNRSNFFLMDGIDDQGSFQSTYSVAPIVDQIEEFKVDSHNDQAEFGGVLGGVINVVTKSGTNQLHGSAWEFLRNNDLDARNTFYTSVTPYRQNQFGVAVGGPVWFPKIYNGRNKTFFFGAYEGTRFTEASNNYLHIPTPAELSGNLAGEAQAYNPFSTAPATVSGEFVRTPFPGNQIPASLINTTLVNFVKQILPPIQNIGIGNYNSIDPTPYVQTQNEFSARIDQTLGTRTLSGSATAGSTTTRRPPADCLDSLRPPTIRPSITAPVGCTFSPTLVLQAQFGRAAQQNNGQTVNPSISSSTISSLGFASSFGGNFIATPLLLPSVGISGYSNPVPGTSDTLDPKFTDIWEYKANVSKIIGSRHTLRWGGELSSNTSESVYANANVGFAYQQTGNLGEFPPSPAMPWLPSCWMYRITRDDATFTKPPAGAESWAFTSRIHGKPRPG